MIVVVAIIVGIASALAAVELAERRRGGQLAYSAADHARARKAHQRQLAAIRNRARELKSDPRLSPELAPSVTAVIEAAQEREP